MRTNWFAPFHRHREERRILLRLFGALGPTWAASPVRRAVQCLCFLAFFWLFGYVCWPYTARPPRLWHNWVPVKVDAEQGEVTLASQPPAELPLPPGTRLHASDPGLGERGYLGEFEVRRCGPGGVELRPAGSPSREQLDALAASVGPWTLAEHLPGQWPSHYADSLGAKEHLPAEMFLVLDPLVSLSAALASRSWVWPLAAAGGILLACALVPRGFCGYLCPLGTLIDLVDWLIARRGKWFRVKHVGRWAMLRHALLAAVVAAAACGIMLAGFVAAMPVVTRGAAFLLTPLQTGFARDWHQIPPWQAGHWLSLGLFGLALALGFLQPRFWCRHVCPSGAIFSLGTWLRVTERKVLASCVECGKCREICPFDAIASDFTTRPSRCAYCQTCGGVCPAHAIQFAGRWDKGAWKRETAAGIAAPATGRRVFLWQAAGVFGGAVGGLGAAAAIRQLAAGSRSRSLEAVVRPPGSVPEPEFLQLCVRCGECYQACPNNALQPMGLRQGLDRLWTPQVVADWSGCEPSCSNCGQVCPTGAIRALPLAEKRSARMGLAIVDQATCLPYAGKEACQLCVDECHNAGYHAIEFLRVGTELDALGQPIEGSGFLAPAVQPDRCVGCGLCQTRCYRINVQSKRRLAASAIVVNAGPGKEDRLRSGSYVQQREAERRNREASQRERAKNGAGHGYLPDFMK